MKTRNSKHCIALAHGKVRTKR